MSLASLFNLSSRFGVCGSTAIRIIPNASAWAARGIVPLDVEIGEAALLALSR
jgi:hypothetical protein